MRKNLMMEILEWVSSKKKFSQKVSCVLKALIFVPFLLFEGGKQEKGSRNRSDGNSTVDDIYPLF